MNGEKEGRKLREMNIEEERRKKIEKAKKLDKSWQMASWMNIYIEENSYRWKKKKIERMIERRKVLDEWER